MKYRKKPVVIEALPVRVIIDLMTNKWSDLPQWVKDAYEDGTIVAITNDNFTVKTLEGDHLATNKDMLIQGIKGELYPCKSEIFKETYELVSE